MKNSSAQASFFYFFMLPFIAFGQLGTNSKYTLADSTTANQLYDEAVKELKNRNLDPALKKATEAKEIYISIFGERVLKVSSVLHTIGRVYELKEDNKNAIDNYTKSINLRKKLGQGESAQIASTINNLGNCYSQNKEGKKALEYYSYAKQIRLKIFGPNHAETNQSNHNIASTLSELGNIDSALTMFKTVLEIDSINYGVVSKQYSDALLELGNAFLHKSSLRTAIKYYEKSFTIRNQILKKDNPELAAPLVNIGKCYTDLGDYDESLRYLYWALDIAKKKYGDTHPRMASIYSQIGENYFYKLNYTKAIEWKNKAINIRIKTYGENHVNTAFYYHDIGGCYRAYGQAFEDKDYLKKSLVYFDKALEIFKKNQGDSCDRCADLYNSIGIANGFLKNTDLAIDAYAQSMNIKLLKNQANSLTFAGVYNNLANAYRWKKEYDKSIYYHQQAIEIQKNTVNDIDQLAGYYSNLAVDYAMKGDIDSSITWFEYAIDFFTQSPFSRTELGKNRLVKLFESTAKVNLQKYIINENELACLIKASDYYKKIIEIGRDLDENSINAEAKTYKHYLHLAYEGDIRTYNMLRKKMTLPDKSPTFFDYAEQTKAAQLLEVLQASGAKTFAHIPDSLLKIEHDLLIDISFWDGLKNAEETKGANKDDSLIISYGARVFDLNVQLDSFVQLMELHYPDYKALKYKRPEISIPVVQSYLANSTLLEYFTADSSIFLFLLNKDSYEVKEIKRDFPLESWVAQIQSGLSGYYALGPNDVRRTIAFRDSCEKQYITAARKLYDKLVKPAELGLKESVIIIPDGVLGYIPFEVLLSGPVPANTKRYNQYPYMFRKHNIRYNYSATLLKEMTDKKHRRVPEKMFAAFAPYYDGDTTVLAGLDDLFTSKTVSPGDLQPLKYSGAEVTAAQKLMGGDVFTDTSATEEHFIQVSGDYSIIHLSTHGKADDRVGDYSYLLFSPKKDSLENELLYCRDIYNLSLNADLVVLSACETGLGKLRKGEGIVSLARAFAYAGAKSIVNSLWSVNDASTQELMVGFYSELRRGVGKSEALAKAKRRFLEEPTVAEKRRYEKLHLHWEDFRHPYYWAGFILIGDDGAVR